MKNNIKSLIVAALAAAVLISIAICRTAEETAPAIAAGGAGRTAAHKAQEAANKAIYADMAAEILPETKTPEKGQKTPQEAQPVNLGTFRLTAYCSCGACCGKWAENRPVDESGKEIVYTASGAVAAQGRTVAVDPAVIPLGSVLYIGGAEYVAEDTGGGIVGNSVDIYFDSHEDALEFGLQYGEVSILQ